MVPSPNPETPNNLPSLDQLYVCYKWIVTYAYTQQPRKRSGRKTAKKITSCTIEVLGIDIAGALSGFVFAFKKSKRQATVDEIMGMRPKGVAFAFVSADPSNTLSWEDKEQLPLPVTPTLREVMDQVAKLPAQMAIPFTPPTSIS